MPQQNPLAPGYRTLLSLHAAGPLKSTCGLKVWKEKERQEVYLFLSHITFNTINDCRGVILEFKGHTMETVESQTILKPFSPEFHFEVQPKYNAKGVSFKWSLVFILAFSSSLQQQDGNQISCQYRNYRSCCHNRRGNIMKVFSDKSGEIIKILIICTKVHLLSKIANTLKLIGLFLLF